MEFREMTAAEIGRKIRAGEMTAVDAVKAALAEIREQEPVLNSFVTVDEEGSLKRAAEVQKGIESGELQARWQAFRLPLRTICVRRA